LNESEELEPDSPTFKPTALVHKLTKHIDDIVEAGGMEDRIISALALEAGLEVKQVQDILSGAASRPSDAKLKAFARVLDVSFDGLKEAAERDGANSIKGMFEARLEGTEPTPSEIYETYSSVMKKIADVAQSSTALGQPFDYEARAREAGGELDRYMTAQSVKQVAAHVASDDADKEFYLKSIINPEREIPAIKQLDLEDHSLLVVSALKGIGGRFRGNHEARLKAGRVLSQRNRDRIGTLREQIQGLDKELETLLAESAPTVPDEEKNAALLENLRLEHQRITTMGALNHA
jgi:transcriptional regulator with XRE-family HTH domain